MGHYGHEELGLMVTANCNWGCKNCSQQEFMKDFAGYHMSKEEVELVIKRMKEMNLRYICLTGGEPLTWNIIEDACKILYVNNMSVRINTNHSLPDVYKKIKPYITIAHRNSKEHHIELPMSPSRKLPANCHCPHTSYINGKVYMCGNAYSTGRRVGVRVPVCSIYDDWLKYFKTIDMFNQEVCKYCHANY